MSDERIDIDLLKKIDRNLERIFGIMVIQGKEQDLQYRILFDLGFDAPLIASILGTSANAVRQKKHRMKKTV